MKQSLLLLGDSNKKEQMNLSEERVWGVVSMMEKALSCVATLLLPEGRDTQTRALEYDTIGQGSFRYFGTLKVCAMNSAWKHTGNHYK